MSQIKKLLEVARAEIGYHEKETNAQLSDKYANAGDENYTKYGAWYGVNGQRAAWCAMFVSWCAQQAGVSNLIGAGSCVYQLCDHILSHGGKMLRLEDAPQPGDITTNLWAGNTDGLPDHVGIVESYDAGSRIITVIEGNVSDQVKRVTYDYQDRLDDTVWRIYRPAYKDTYAPQAKKDQTNSAVVPPIPPEKDRVKLFQEACIADGLPLNVYGADGIWGAETAAAACDTVQRGDCGLRVKLIQRLLIGDVWAYGGDDGIFGNGTDKAVRKYQGKYGLAVDGIVGLQTWKTMLGV